MNSFWQDVRHGFRMMRKASGLTILVIFTLATGIGANTAIYSFVNALLLRPLPYSNPDRLVHIWETLARNDSMRLRASYPDYLDWAQQNNVFEGLAGYDPMKYTLLGQGLPSRISGTLVTTNFFSVLGVQPVLGRDFLPDESEPVALVSYGFWQRYFGGDSSVLGKTVNLSYQPFTVIGVLPANFEFAIDEGSVVWVPVKPTGNQVARRSNRWLGPIGRLKPSITLEQARVQMSGIAERLAREYPETNAGVGVRLVPLRDEIIGNVRPMLLMLLAAVVFVLLIVCANVANLLAVRGVARRREFAMRLALGASRRQLVQQLMVESVMLSLLGGLGGLWIASWATRFLILPGNILSKLPMSQDVALDWRVLGFNFLFAAWAGMIVGVAPALQSFRISGLEALKEVEQWSVGKGQKRLGSLLVVSEVALLFVLMAGTGLVLMSLQRLMQVDPGFRADHLLTVGISLPAAKYPTAGQMTRFFEELLNKVAAAPGVRQVAMVDELPLTDYRINTNVYAAGKPRPPIGMEHGAVVRTVSPSYFECVGIPLTSGREFTPGDHMQAERVVIVSKSLASRLFQSEDPIGQRVVRNGSVWAVVGVVGDVKLGALDRPTPPSLYTASLQEPSNTNDLVIRTSIPAAEVSNTVRRLVQELDPELPARSMRTMKEIVQESPSVFTRRSTAWLLFSFALMALLLATTGLYGIVSYGVAQRTREIGLRMALGAQPAGILRIILKFGLGMAFRGILLGLVCSIALTRFMSSLLFGVSATDPLILMVVSAVLVGVTLLACYLPARRAAMIDPAEALRHS